MEKNQECNCSTGNAGVQKCCECPLRHCCPAVKAIPIQPIPFVPYPVYPVYPFYPTYPSWEPIVTFSSDCVGVKI